MHLLNSYLWQNGDAQSLIHLVHSSNLFHPAMSATRGENTLELVLDFSAYVVL